jgi:uncharacterized membrane-anchored protein
MRLPPDHPLRSALNDEVHARPPEALVAPLRLSYLALFLEDRERQWRSICALAERYGRAPPIAGANHYSADLGPFRLKWERHTEFSRFKFIVAGAGEDPFAAPAIDFVPADWLENLPGEVITAAHLALVRARADSIDIEAVSRQFFDGHVLVGARVAGGAAITLTDFQVRADGFARFLVEDQSMTPRQAGRTVQRLVEIDAYRLMALLALPVARQLAPALSQTERELSEITAALVHASQPDEPLLLERLTRLQAEIESRQTGNLFRFSAANAYYELVQRRIGELREERLPGLQTFQEFTERRLAPAIHTSKAAAARQDSLSERVARVTQLLSTRVDITRERQNQALLASMNRRARLQLRLQQTVEGLSIAAVTYYIVSLVAEAARALHAAGVKVEPDLVAGVSIPIVAILTAIGVHRIRKIVARERAPGDSGDEPGDPMA